MYSVIINGNASRHALLCMNTLWYFVFYSVMTVTRFPLQGINNVINVSDRILHKANQTPSFFLFHEGSICILQGSNLY